MATVTGLTVGEKVKEIATRDIVYQSCTVLGADAVGLAFEVERTISEGGTIENVVSQMLVPWVNVQYVLLADSRT